MIILHAILISVQSITKWCPDIYGKGTLIQAKLFDEIKKIFKKKTLEALKIHIHYYSVTF